MLSCYQFMKQKLIFITKIYTQESFFYAEDKNFNIGEMLYYIKISRLFAAVLMFKHLLKKIDMA